MSRYSTNYSCKAATLAVALLLSGCASEGEPRSFLATIVPLRLVAEPVVGEPVGVLVRAGVSPHTYEPRPSDVRRTAEGSVLFFASPELDGWAASLNAEARLGLVNLLPDSVRRAAVGERGVDPHFWMDPLAVKVLVPALADTLCYYDGSQCAAYRRNAEAFAGELDYLHDSLKTLMAPVAGSSILLGHPFLGYFSARYGLSVAGVIEEQSGSEPSPRRMRRLMETARKFSVRAIFVQPQHSPRAAEALGDMLGIPVVELDPLGDADNLRDLLYLNAERIRSTLSPSPADP